MGIIGCCVYVFYLWSDWRYWVVTRLGRYAGVGRDIDGTGLEGENGGGLLGG